MSTTENECHSDSDWLDVASTDRDSDDTDSVYSSRETDHDDLSRSRSRRSSLSYDSSPDGGVDAWEGLIDDSADEGVSSDPPAPNHHVPSPPLLPPSHLDPPQDSSPEDLRVQEALDQSMISTLSSSRSSSLHTSTVHTSSRDLRLSFPDPITSSCRDPLSTSYEEIQHNSDIPVSPAHSDVPLDAQQHDDAASQLVSTLPQPAVAPSSSGPELMVFLYGLSTVFKWSIVDKVLQKAAHGVGLVIDRNLDNSQGSPRHLSVSGSFERDPAFPRVITVFDRTLQLHDAADDLALMNSAVVRPLAVVFMPCHSLQLPEHVLHLPVQVFPSYHAEPYVLGNVEMGSRNAQGTFDVPNRQLLRIAASEDSPIVNKDSIDMLDSTRVYRAFSRLWSSDNNVPKGIMASTHALTIIAILSLVLGMVVRAALPTSLQYSTAPTLGPNYTPTLFWQIFRPTPYRERLPASTSLDSSVVAASTSFRELSLSVFSAESTSMTLSPANPTNFRRLVPSTLSESSDFSKDLMLQPPHSVLLAEDRPKALSVIQETSSAISSRPDPTTSPLPIPPTTHTSVPAIVKEYSSVAFAAMNQDMQDILDALDALAQAISRQTYMIVAQVTAFIEQSAIHWEKSVGAFETAKETLFARNEHARKRAREIKERGTRWLYDASEAIATGAQLSKGMAMEMAESLASRAQRAKGRAREIAAEIQGLLNEHDKEAHETCPWDKSTKHWEKWVRRVRRQGKRSKSCKSLVRKRDWAIF